MRRPRIVENLPSLARQASIPWGSFMIRLKPVLLVRELPPAFAKLRSHLPSLKELVSKTPHPNEPELIEYLQKGVFCGVLMDRGLVFDVLQPGKKIALSMNPLIQPHCDFTDGVWIWSGALVYYIIQYHVSLDPKFVCVCEKPELAN